MDLAEAGNQLGALRLLSHHASSMPPEKIDADYCFVLRTGRNK